MHNFEQGTRKGHIPRTTNNSTESLHKMVTKSSKYKLLYVTGRKTKHMTLKTPYQLTKKFHHSLLRALGWAAIKVSPQSSKISHRSFQGFPHHTDQL